MSLGLLGQKIGMTQVLGEDGKMIPVTVLKVGPCPVLQVRSQEKDGYDALQIGFMEKPRRLASKSERGHVSSKVESKRRKKQTGAGVVLQPKAEIEPHRFVRELRLEQPATQQVGATLTTEDIFTGVKAVDVIGNTKGRGFTGVMKRHNFSGQPAAHGAKKVHRCIGSLASLASNRGGGRPKKGRKMAGHYGNERVTIRNLEVIRVDPTEHMMLVYGAVPGPNGGIVMIRPTNKKRKVQTAT